MVHSEILPTPTHSAVSGVWTFYGSATINAPAHKVWGILLDFRNYSEWNHYTPTVGTPNNDNVIVIGDTVTLAYRPEPTGSTMDVPCEILTIDNDAMELCWRGMAMGLPKWLFVPEKVQRVTPKGENQCFVEIFETQGGPMAYVVKWSMGEKLSRMSQGMCEGLKEYAEK